MLFLLVLAALLLPFALTQDSAELTITVLSTTLITITSGHPSVTDCPGRNLSLSSSSIVSLPPTSPSLSPSNSSSASPCPRSRCNADNCLRAFERGQGQQFCSTFTQSIVTDTSSLPSYITMCAGSAISRVSSACSCLNNASACIETSSAAVQSLARGCNADNCLRAFERGEGQAFCSSFTQSIVTSIDGLPSYRTQCTGSTIARVSSACYCLNANAHTSQQTFSTPVSVNTYTSQPAFSSPVASASSQIASTSISKASSAAQTSQPIQSSASGQTAGASVSVGSSAAQTSQPIGSSAPTQVFSFTTVGTNSQGSLFTSIIRATLAPSSAGPSSQSAQSPTPASAQPSSQPLQVFSFTTTGTNAQGSTFSSVVATLTPSQSSAHSVISSAAPSQPAQSSAEIFSFTSTGTDAQGSPFSTIIVATIAPSSSGASAAAPSLEPFFFTSTGTDAQGSSFTSIIQGTFTSSGVALPFTSTEVGTDAQGSIVTSLFTGLGFPFTSTVRGTDAQGSPFTSLFTGTALAPGGSFTGFPLPTSPPQSGSLPFSLSPQTTSAPQTLCSPWPFCLYSPATNIPKNCSPFPGCLSDVIPNSVQNELSGNCGTTSILDCILGEPNAPCNQWPQCLSTVVGTSICDGFPFPDCLFTLYSPIVTSTITTNPPGLTEISISIPDLTSNTITQTRNSQGIAVWWPVFGHIGCPECGDWDRILGNLPTDFTDLFNIDFTLPGFPKIPEFHFPVSQGSSSSF
jgi:hypothetical protein